VLHRWALIVVASLALAACEPPYHDVPCWLPILRTEGSTRTLVNVGDVEDRSSNRCPIPVARTFEADRVYGTINFEWWGSPHKLYMSANGENGRKLGIRGDGIEVYEDPEGSWLSAYSHKKTFPGNDLLDRPVPEGFAFEILEADGRSLDSFRATYEVVLCSCSVPNYVSGAPR
jgi:hypothetical protein